MMPQLPAKFHVQQIAKKILAACSNFITPDDTEKTICDYAVREMAAHGVSQTLYHNCPALVLLGGRSCLSVSGGEYAPASEPVGCENLVTIDLSPLLNGVWGDCARSIVIEGGQVVDKPTCSVFNEGLLALDDLHAAIRQYINPETRFCDLYEFANQAIVARGFENLDFHGNVGHSIVTSLSDRGFIEPGNESLLACAPLFTIEPHIRRVGGQWGFKHEDIYYFNDDGVPTVL